MTTRVHVAAAEAEAEPEEDLTFGARFCSVDLTLEGCLIAHGHFVVIVALHDDKFANDGILCGRRCERSERRNIGGTRTAKRDGSLTFDFDLRAQPSTFKLLSNLTLVRMHTWG